MDRERLDSAIAFLESCPPVEYSPREPYPANLDLCFDLLEPDYDYLSHKNEIDEKGVEIEDMSIDEVAAMLTFFSRGERFCDGFTAEIVNGGELLRVLKRLRELWEK